MNVREVSPARDILPHHQACYKATRDARQEAADADYSSQSEEEEEDEDEDEADLDLDVEEDDDAASVAMSMSEMSLMDEDLDGYGDDYAYNDADNGFALMFGPSTPRRRRAGPTTARIPANPSRKRRTGKKAAEVPGGPEAPQTTPHGYLEGQRAKGGSGPSTVRFVTPTRKDGVLRANKQHELELYARGPLDAPPRKIDLTATPRKTKKNSKTAKATVPLFTPQERADCEMESQRLWREHERTVTLESIDLTSRRVVEDASNPFIAAPPSPGNWNEQVDHEGPAFEDSPHPPPSPQLPASAGVVLHPDRLALMQQKDPLDFFLSDPPSEPTWSATAASSGANATVLVKQRWGSSTADLAHAVRFDDAFEFHPGPVISDGQVHADGEPEDGELSDTGNSAQELSSTLRRLSFGDVIDDNAFERQRSQPRALFHELEPLKKGAMNAAVSTRPFGEMEEGEIEDEPSESDGWEGKGEPVSALVWRSDSEDDANTVDGALEVDEW
ncbi:hypothetical protein EXIGLDRAFT_24780 [Exidia glandulosa HHB12029]|uniref:Uncharacterized protein n=1 Tax=Exidia glandulosa HHB12029 TaxID=1314781 RepID=A0A165R2M5_EXIGL|nr:hypothetical protein EXIGLDRAFT_24780 [Exidia glandulosa HHB12029]